MLKNELQSDYVNNFQVSPHFNLSEFECPCCWQVRLVPRLVYLLEKLRKKVGEPILVSSGYRCPKHNKVIGGAKHSYHMQGKAADIYTKRTSVEELGRLAHEVGFPTVILYPRHGFIHVDIRGKGLGLVGE